MSFSSAEFFRKLETGLISTYWKDRNAATKAKKRRKRLELKRKSIEFRDSVKAAKKSSKLNSSKTSVDPKPLTQKQIEYRQYLKSDHWITFRLTILAKRGAECERCMQRRGPFDLHHRTYERLGHELETDVEVLCRFCHEEQHGRFKPRPISELEGSLVGANPGERRTPRNISRRRSPTNPSARPMYGREREGRGEAESTLTWNQPGSEYPGQAGA